MAEEARCQIERCSTNRSYEARKTRVHFKNRIPADIAGITNIIYDLRGRNEVRRSENGVLFEELRQAAMIDSVKSSNAIEGIVTTIERVLGKMVKEGIIEKIGTYKDARYRRTSTL